MKLELEEKLAKLTQISKDRSDQLERNKKIWIQEVSKLYQNIREWFGKYIQKGYITVSYGELPQSGYIGFIADTYIMYLNLGGEQGPSIIFEPTGINVAGALGKIDLYFLGHKDEGVFLLLIEEDVQFYWEIWKSRKEGGEKFNKESLEELIDNWLEKWAEI
jgi:hypothetical protein